MTRKKQTRTAPETTAAAAISKKDIAVALLHRDGGTTLAEISDATAWLPHTARAMLTGLRKKGFSVSRERVEGTTRYSIAREPAA